MIGRPVFIVLAAGLAFATLMLRPSRGAAVRGLTGEWRAAFTLVQALPHAAKLEGTRIEGTLFIPPRPRPSHSIPPARADPTAMDFTRLGLPAGVADGGVEVHALGGDSLRIRLGRGMELRGIRRGDSITGSWTHPLRGAGARGAFVLHRGAHGDTADDRP